MDVEAAVTRRIEHGAREDEAIGGDHRDIRVERGEVGLRLGILQRDGGAHRDAERLGPLVNGRGHQRAAAPAAGAGRLAVGRDDIVPGRDQCLERGHGEVGRSHEDDPHGARFNALARGDATPYLFPRWHRRRSRR